MQCGKHSSENVKKIFFQIPAVQSSVHFFQALQVYSFMEHIYFKTFTVSKLTFKSNVKWKVKKQQMKAIRSPHLFCGRIKSWLLNVAWAKVGRGEKNVFLNLGMILLDWHVKYSLSSKELNRLQVQVGIELIFVFCHISNKNHMFLII